MIHIMKLISRYELESLPDICLIQEFSMQGCGTDNYAILIGI